MNEGFVYVIHAIGTSRVKIGYSHNPEARSLELQTGSPFPLALVGARPGSLTLEACVHGALSEYRCIGEWFEIDPQEALRVMLQTEEMLPERELPYTDALLTQLQSQLSEINERAGSVRLFQRKDGLGILLMGVSLCPHHQLMHAGPKCPMC